MPLMDACGEPPRLTGSGLVSGIIESVPVFCLELSISSEMIGGLWSV